MTSSLFCFGLGYSGGAVARDRAAAGWRVAGTVRDLREAGPLRAAGCTVWQFDLGRFAGDLAAVLAPITHLLVTVPPGNAAGAAVDPVFDLVGERLAELAPALDWLGYLSTTGVYGDRGGAWVDETAALRPTSARAARRVAAEAAWRGLHERQGLPVHVFRLAGIYGPGRNALAAMRAGRGRRIVKPGQVFSRIHLADLVAVLAASMARPTPGAVYNVCDDEPAPPEDVVAYACRLLGIDPPPAEPFDAARLDAMAASFYADNKRVCNARIKRELGVRLIHPNYRAGLEALLD